MDRTSIDQLASSIGERVTVRGWVQTIRDQKRMQFVILSDSTGLAQAVLAKGEEPSELNAEISALTAESAVSVTGTVAADERVKLGGLEMKIEELTVEAALPSRSFPSPPTPPWTSASTGASWTSAVPTAA